MVCDKIKKNILAMAVKILFLILRIDVGVGLFRDLYEEVP